MSRTLLTLACLCHVVRSQTIRELGSMTMRQAGFSAVYDHGDDVTDATERYSIIISCFSAVPGTRDDVNFIRYVNCERNMCPMQYNVTLKMTNK